MEESEYRTALLIEGKFETAIEITAFFEERLLYDWSLFLWNLKWGQYLKYIITDMPRYGGKNFFRVFKRHTLEI